MRRGFGLITAIVIMVTVGTLMALMIGLSSASVKNTTDLYLKEQAELLAKSATEYALLAISGHDNTVNCVKNINMRYPSAANPTHEANVSIMYLGNGIPAACAPNILDNDVNTSESNLTVIIDTIVATHPDLNLTETIRIHRRTIQKP